MKNKKIPPSEKNEKAGGWGVPEPMLATGSHMELNGNREAIVEGCGGVLEYDGGVVRVKTGRLVAKFSGRNLVIKCLTADSLVIQGYITAIEFTA